MSCICASVPFEARGADQSHGNTRLEFLCQGCESATSQKPCSCGPVLAGASRSVQVVNWKSQRGQTGRLLRAPTVLLLESTLAACMPTDPFFQFPTSAGRSTSPVLLDQICLPVHASPLLHCTPSIKLSTLPRRGNALHVAKSKIPRISRG
jgi:hypothetical protein